MSLRTGSNNEPDGIKASLDMSSLVPPDIMLACEGFSRCLGCGAVSGGPKGFTMTRCSCGSRTFAEATQAEFVAYCQPQN